MSQNEFKIIRILSDTKFVINGGTVNEIQVDDKFKIVDPNANPLEDLDGNVIGHLGAKKATLIAKEVHDTFSILRTKFVPAVKSSQVPSAFQATALKSTRQFVQSLQGNIDTTAHYQRVDIDPSEMEPEEKTDEPIHKGDTAIKI